MSCVSILHRANDTFVSASTPDKTIKDIMGKLGDGEQRHKPYFPFSPIPTAAKQPILFMPDTAIPEQLFDIRESPKRCKKYQPMLRDRTIYRPGCFAFCFGVKIDQCKIRHAVNDHIGHRECVI